MTEEVHICTAQDPWSKDKGESANHPDAVCTYDGGWEQEYERYRCPHCGLSFKVEIAG